MAYGGKRIPQNDDKKTKKKNIPGRAFIILIMILLTLVILFCAVMIAVNSYLNRIERVEDDIDIVPPENEDFETDDTAGDTELNPDAPIIKDEDVRWWESSDLDDDHLINIMLVGQDSRDSSRQRSDAMILCSINPDTGEVALISFLRDTYVQMPEGYKDNRMNAAYYYGGFDYLYEVMDINFGITCDGGIEVNFDGFIDVVNAIDGIDIELTTAEAKIVGGGAVAGWNHLSGEQALTYSRIRKLDSDFGRTNRQRNVLEAIFNKVKGMGMTELLNLVNTLIPMVTTDLTNAQIIDIAVALLPTLSNLELNSYSIPTSDAYYLGTIRGMSVLVPDLELCQKYLTEDFLPFS